MEHLDKPIPAPVKMGDVVFFKQFKKTTGNTPELRSVGQMFAMLLGEVPPGGKQPEGLDIIQGMGAIGFILFDDVLEILGQEHEKKLIEAYQAKYVVAVQPPPEAESKIIPPSPAPKISLV